MRGHFKGNSVSTAFIAASGVRQRRGRVMGEALIDCPRYGASSPPGSNAIQQRTLSFHIRRYGELSSQRTTAPSERV